MSEAENLIRAAFKQAGRHNDPKLDQAIAKLRPAGYHKPRDAAYWAMAELGLVDHDTLALQPSGVDPELQAQIKALFDSARALRNQAQAEERQANDLARAAVAAKGGIHPSRVELSSFHACDGSPTGHCAYDLDGEHGSDECMFCGQPDERL